MGQLRLKYRTTSATIFAYLTFQFSPPSSLAACNAPEMPALTDPTIVGDGTPASCTESAFKSALANGGDIAFNCGSDPHTITLTSEALVNTSLDTRVDGNGLITLSGGGTTRILNMDTGNFELTSPTLTVLNMTFTEGRSSGTETALGTHYDGGGAAIYYVGGNVHVYNSTFTQNRCDDLGPDLAGGAIFGNGRGETIAVDSHFSNNSCANGGAIGNLWTSTYLYNTTVENNEARGNGANYEGGEHGNGDGNQQGSGGNGGGIQMDGAENDMLLCNVNVLNNSGNALGGGIFRTTYYGTGTMVIDQSLIEGNVVTDQPDFSAAGGLFFMGGPITITDTTFRDNEANIFGAIQLEDSETDITFNRIKVTDNVARTGLAAIWIGDAVTGSISSSNISNNTASGSGGFAAAFAGSGITGVTLTDTAIMNNVAGNGYNPISCWSAFIDGGNNFQWPVERSGEGSDDPNSLCSENISVGLPTTTDLSFTSLQPSYQVGDRLTVTVEANREIANESTQVDLWVAVALPDGALLFFTESDTTLTPTPYKSGLSRSDESHTVFEFDIPSGLEGSYRFYGIYNEHNVGIDDLSNTMRSNLAFYDIVVE